MLIDENYTAKLCDFGLVRVLGEEFPESLMTTTAYAGTLRYVSPELVWPPEDVDFAQPTLPSDIYALGCLALEVRTIVTVGPTVDNPIVSISEDPL